MSDTGIRPIFVFGIARSGTNLLARVLDAHSTVEIALDPFMPVFKAVRNAIIAHCASRELRDGFDPACPFQDGYQKAHGYELLDLLLDGDLAAPIDAGELAALPASVAARAALEAPDIAAEADQLAGATCRDLVASALAIVARARAHAATRWVGIKEVWVLDFLPALARAFPTAKFVAIERDPRAVIASLATLAQSDPSQHGHSISYFRHWRKTVVLARRFSAEPTLADRFRLVRYEDLAARPTESVGQLADFLGLAFEPRMLAPASNGAGAWRANSSYQDPASGISDASTERWRKTLPDAAIRTAEFFCAPEMALAGYPLLSRGTPDLSPDIAAYVAQADADPGSWRSDSGDLPAEMAFEKCRHDLLRRLPTTVDPARVRRCFLFAEAYRAILAAQPR
jgi:hypothetical protein